MFRSGTKAWKRRGLGDWWRNKCGKVCLCVRVWARIWSGLQLQGWICPGLSNWTNWDQDANCWADCVLIQLLELSHSYPSVCINVSSQVMGFQPTQTMTGAEWDHWCCLCVSKWPVSCVASMCSHPYMHICDVFARICMLCVCVCVCLHTAWLLFGLGSMEEQQPFLSPSVWYCMMYFPLTIAAILQLLSFCGPSPEGIFWSSLYLPKIPTNAGGNARISSKWRLVSTFSFSAKRPNIDFFFFNADN